MTKLRRNQLLLSAEFNTFTEILKQDIQYFNSISNWFCKCRSSVFNDLIKNYDHSLITTVNNYPIKVPEYIEAH